MLFVYLGIIIQLLNVVVCVWRVCVCASATIALGRKCTDKMTDTMYATLPGGLQGFF